MGALWVSWCVGFHVLGTPGKGGEKGTSEEEGDPFSQPCHVTAGPVVGAALCVLVHGPAVQSRTGAEAQRLPWKLLVGVLAIFTPAAGVPGHLGGRARFLSTLLPLTAL